VASRLRSGPDEIDPSAGKVRPLAPPLPPGRILTTAPACPATILGMGILRDAILSVVISVAAVGTAELLGWAWYVLGLLWLGK
jgi:hypothetical protein